MELFVGEEQKTLSRTESNLLAFFMDHPGYVFTREELLENLWLPSNEIGSPRIVDVYVCRLRETCPAIDMMVLSLALNSASSVMAWWRRSWKRKPSNGLLSFAMLALQPEQVPAGFWSSPHPARRIARVSLRHAVRQLLMPRVGSKCAVSQAGKRKWLGSAPRVCERR